MQFVWNNKGDKMQVNIFTWSKKMERFSKINVTITMACRSMLVSRYKLHYTNTHTISTFRFKCLPNSIVPFFIHAQSLEYAMYLAPVCRAVLNNGNLNKLEAICRAYWSIHTCLKRISSWFDYFNIKSYSDYTYFYCSTFCKQILQFLLSTML